MNALNSLRSDHRLTARVLDAFEIYLGNIKADSFVERFDLLRFIAFFQDYGNLYHHVKEESFLFSALVSAGESWLDGPLSRLRREHDREHQLLRSLDRAALFGNPWFEDDRRRFSNVAEEFLSFQRNHMRFESVEVFPLVERALSDLALARLDRDMERFETANRELVLSASAVAEALTRRYLANRPTLCENGVA